MPPKPKITREMILNAVLNLTKRDGFGAVNARSVAKKLQCSTRPIFTCYKNMEELEQDFADFAFEYYETYVSDYGRASGAAPYLLLPLSYIDFAEKEPFLFKFLFMDDMELDMREAGDFYRESQNSYKAEQFSRMLGIDSEAARDIFLDLFFYAHGIAVLTASEKLSFRPGTAEKMLCRFLSAYTGRKI